MCLFYKVSQDVSVTLAKLGYHPGYHHPFLYLDTRYTFVRFGLPYSNTRGYGAIYMLWCEYNKCKSPLEFSMFSAGVDYHARAAGRGKLRGKQQLRERNNNWGRGTTIEGNNKRKTIDGEVRRDTGIIFMNEINTLPMTCQRISKVTVHRLLALTT